MNAAVSTAEKAAILAHYTAQAADAALMGPALGHPADPRTSPSETASSLRFIIDDALEALYRASDALDKADRDENLELPASVSRRRSPGRER